MRKHFLTTVAALAIATPALAADLSGGYVPPSGDPVYSSAPMVQGDLEMSLGWTQFSADGEDERSVNNFSGWARANVPVGNTWNILFETGGSAIFGGDIPDGFSLANLSANAHIWGGSNGFRYGAFGGVTYGELIEVTFGSVGVEAEADMGNVTLGGQGFYSWTSADCCGPVGDDAYAYGVRGWADYYFMPDTKVTGELSWTHLNEILNDEVDIWGGSARVTHRFAGTPFNIFGEAGYWNVDFGGGDVDIVNVLAGFTILLDGADTTQQAHDQQVPFSFRSPLGAAGSFGGLL